MLWARFWWLTVPEPRLLSIGWGVVYLAVLCAGVAALTDPPLELLGADTGALVQVSIGGLNTVGALVAMASGYRDFWRGERLGLALMSAAGLIYGGLLLHVRDRLGVSVAVPLAYLAAMLCVLGLRMLMIRWFTYRPRG